jgi:hypothetical protein
VILSGSINLFDGSELLRAQLTALRGELDHVSVIFQERSNRGARSLVPLAPLLRDLVDDGLVDEFVRCEPSLPTEPVLHESRKRTLGLDLARARGATHYLSLDVDEFYRPSELATAKAQVEQHGWDATACCVQDYHAGPCYRRVGLTRYLGMDLHVPLICEIGDRMRYDPALPYFCCIDPSRRTPFRSAHAFPPSEIVLHHMTTVRGSRASLVQKFANSTSRSRFQQPAELADLVWRWSPATRRTPRVEIVADEFSIQQELDRSPERLRERSVL